MDVPAALLRAARTALGLSREELAEKAGVSLRTIVKVERNDRVKIETMRKIQAGLEQKGIRFLDSGDGAGPGLRMPLEPTST